MSFSFSAGGSLDETLSSLNKDMSGMSSDGKKVRELVLSFLEDSAKDARIRYTVAASGHHAPDGLPYLSVTITSAWTETGTE